MSPLERSVWLLQVCVIAIKMSPQGYEYAIVKFNGTSQWAKLYFHDAGKSRPKKGQSLKVYVKHMSVDEDKKKTYITVRVTDKAWIPNQLVVPPRGTPAKVLPAKKHSVLSAEVEPAKKHSVLSAEVPPWRYRKPIPPPFPPPIQMAYPPLAYPPLAYPHVAYPNVAYPHVAYPPLAYPHVAYPPVAYPQVAQQRLLVNTPPTVIHELQCIVGSVCPPSAI
jgi:hypothetical protein